MNKIKISFLAVVLLLLTSCGSGSTPQPAQPTSPTAPITLTLDPEIYGTCIVNYLTPNLTVDVEIWVYDAATNTQSQIGPTVTKTNSDFVNSKIQFDVDVPTEGTYYIEVDMEADCEDCCGYLSSTNSYKCPTKYKGRPQWHLKTGGVNYEPLKPNETLTLTYRKCQCNCD